jgi:hypothetical protein
MHRRVACTAELIPSPHNSSIPMDYPSNGQHGHPKIPSGRGGGCDLPSTRPHPSLTQAKATHNQSDRQPCPLRSDCLSTPCEGVFRLFGAGDFAASRLQRPEARRATSPCYERPRCYMHRRVTGTAVLHAPPCSASELILSSHNSSITMDYPSNDNRVAEAHARPRPQGQ